MRLRAQAASGWGWGAQRRACRLPPPARAVPAFLGALTKLDELKLEHNQLTGTIPPELSNMAGTALGSRGAAAVVVGDSPHPGWPAAELKWLRLANNKMVGTVPPDFSKLTKYLVQLTLDSNDFSGVPTVRVGQPHQAAGRAQAGRAAARAHTGARPPRPSCAAGNLYPLSQASLINAGTGDNPSLCGMVPLGVRFGHYFNFHNTGQQ